MAPTSSPVVLIVGAGPVGLTLAAHLNHHGVGCRLIDKALIATDKSKALVIWARTQEMLDKLGIIDAFRGAGIFLNAARLYGGSGPLVRIPFEPTGTMYGKPLMLAQSETERLLAEHLRSRGITVERPVELTELAEQGDHVRATLHHADGRDEEVQCSYLVGCDGAHSTVRKKLAIEFTGAAEPNDWILADTRIEGPLPLDEMSVFWHSKGALVFFPFAEGRCRMVADVGRARGTGKPDDPTLEQAQAIVDERGQAGVRLSDPVWLAGFRINERKVGAYGKGRVFLAGDSAHIHSPAGGQGMNTGMQDAWNLAWKLALVHAGRARTSLLDSYTQERSKVGDVVLRAAARMTWVALLPDPITRFFRNTIVRVGGRLPAFQRNFVRYLAELSIHYPESPLNGETIGPWDGGIRPGDRVPDATLKVPATGREERLHALLRGNVHDLLLLPASADAVALNALEDVRKQAAAAFGDLVRAHLIVPGTTPPAGNLDASLRLDPDGNVRKMMGAKETALALIRPDGYLGYRGQSADWQGLRNHLERYLIPLPA
jgi:2-polyprenyl-6-methoxyphenol hydroxylase-like FAD-dependent oxidoreductase